MAQSVAHTSGFRYTRLRILRKLLTDCAVISLDRGKDMSLGHHALHINVHSFDQQVSLAVDFVRRVDDANQRLGRNAKCEGVVLTHDRATKADDLESRR